MIVKHFQNNTQAGSGNALQACIASILQVENMQDVPNFIEDSRGYLTSISEYLKNLGFGFVKIQCNEDGQLPMAVSPDIRCVVAGNSPRGSHRHCCVGIIQSDGVSISILHDPFPDGGGLDGDALWVGFICRL